MIDFDSLMQIAAAVAQVRGVPADEVINVLRLDVGIFIVLVGQIAVLARWGGQITAAVKEHERRLTGIEGGGHEYASTISANGARITVIEERCRLMAETSHRR